MIHWLLNPEHNALITWIGFAIGVFGTLLGLLGIALTLKQVKALKSEAEATSRAINAVQLKVASFDAAQECGKASDLVLAIRSAFKGRAWMDMLAAYEELIQRFLNLSHSTSLIADDDRQLMIKQTTDMAKMCEAIRRGSNESSFGLRGQDRALRDFSDVITRVTFTVMRSLQQ